MADAVEEDTQFRLLDELEAFKLSGRDKSGRRILRVVGKFFPGKIFRQIFRTIFGYSGYNRKYLLTFRHDYKT